MFEQNVGVFIVTVGIWKNGGKKRRYRAPYKLEPCYQIYNIRRHKLKRRSISMEKNRETNPVENKSMQTFANDIFV